MNRQWPAASHPGCWGNEQTRGQAGVPPAPEMPDWLYPVLNSYANEFDGQESHSARWPEKVGGTSKSGWHRQRWMAPAKVGGWHREMRSAWSTNHAGSPPIAEGISRLSAGPTDGQAVQLLSAADSCQSTRAASAQSCSRSYAARPSVVKTCRTMSPKSTRIQ